MSVLQADEIKDLLQEFPTLKKYSSRLCMIAELVKDAEQETDLSFMARSFKTVLRMQERLYSDLVQYVSDENVNQFKGMEKNCREWKDIAESLEVALKEERQANRETFVGLCMAFLVNPRLVFETVLQFIEREEKCKCSDGYANWQWTFKFSIMHRIRMALKLIFGSRTIKEAS